MYFVVFLSKERFATFWLVTWAAGVKWQEKIARNGDNGGGGSKKYQLSSDAFF